ncbi:hydantoinase/oxoprolinase family protein [Streptomyces sp. NPDC055955]|uniref:hydantoinase/oxoprolinase family protein n=1 Tax=Streptomyces sp. NPDC055955 TaxID=3345665 RepID=UPI0035DB244A
MLGVDVGGTFTDVVAVRDGRIQVTKVPSDPAHPVAPVVAGAQRLGVEDSSVFNHASTMGLNAVITRQLPKIAFLTTEGHRDILDRGRAWRPTKGQTDPAWRRSFGDVTRPLVPRYLRRGLRERALADGTVLVPLDEEQVRAQLAVLARCHVEGVAVCLLNAYTAPSHEQRVRELIHEVLGDIPVSLSSETSALAKEYARASTTVIDVFMKLIFTKYAHELYTELRAAGFRGDLNFADCAATLLPWREALDKPHRIVFAGPAAGTFSSVRLGAAIGEENLLCADVGGTSTDISLVVDGEPFVDTTFELEHDLVINALSTEISSVGAGGGSLVSISSSGDVLVGPGSAGAVPGPACYGRGGELPTVTDACLLMGVIDPAGIAGGELRLDEKRARRAFESLRTPLSLEERVRYAYRIAVANIAEEMANVAIRHGVDPRDFTLVAYGAAGGMLLPAALELLRAKRVVIPPNPGLFSAIGLLSSDLVHYDSRSAYTLLVPEAAEYVDAVFDEIEQQLRERVAESRAGITVKRTFDGRLTGQHWETPFVEVPEGPITTQTVASMIAAFHDAYEKRYGNRFPTMPVEGVTFRVQITVGSEKFEHTELASAPGTTVVPDRTTELRYFADTALPAAEYSRDRLPVGARLRGPAVIREPLSTVFVCPGQMAEIGRFGEISIELEEK